MPGNNNYCWVVFCKNRWFHLLHNIFFRHKILLGLTDDFAPLPALDERFLVRCDVCGMEYLYKPSEVRRSEQAIPEGCTLHPRFW